jgi:hypothetical protein
MQEVEQRMEQLPRSGSFSGNRSYQCRIHRNFGFFRNGYSPNMRFSRLPLVDQCMAALAHTGFE